MVLVYCAPWPALRGTPIRTLSLFADETPANVAPPSDKTPSRAKPKARAAKSSEAPALAVVNAPANEPAPVAAPVEVLPVAPVAHPRGKRSTYERDTHVRAMRTYAASIAKLHARFDGFPELQARVTAAAEQLAAAVPLVEAIPAGWRPAVWASTPIPAAVTAVVGTRVALRASARARYAHLVSNPAVLAGEWRVTARVPEHVIIEAPDGLRIPVRETHLEVPGASEARAAREAALKAKRAERAARRSDTRDRIGF